MVPKSGLKKKGCNEGKAKCPNKVVDNKKELTNDIKGKKNAKYVAKKSRISMSKTEKGSQTESSDSWSMSGEGSSTQQPGAQNQFIFQMQFIITGNRTSKRKNRLRFRKFKGFKQKFGNINWQSKNLEEAFRNHVQTQPVENPDRVLKDFEGNVLDELCAGPEKAVKPEVLVKSGQTKTLKSGHKSQSRDYSYESSRKPRSLKCRNDSPEEECYVPGVKMKGSTRSTRSLRRKSRRVNYEEIVSDSEMNDSNMTFNDTTALKDCRKRKIYKKKKETKCVNKRLKKSSPEKESIIEPSVIQMLNENQGPLNRSPEVPLLQEEELDMDWDTICDEALSLKEMLQSKDELDYLIPQISEESKCHPDSSIPETLEEPKGCPDSSIQETLEESKGNPDSSIQETFDESKGNLDSFSIPEIFEAPSCDSDNSIHSQSFVQTLKLDRRFTVEILSPCVCSESRKSGLELGNEQPEKSSSNLFCLGCTVFKENLLVQKLQMVTQDGVHFCSLCKFKTSKPVFLLDHVAFEHKVTTYKCPSCDYLAQHGPGLKRHYDEFHASPF